MLRRATDLIGRRPGGGAVGRESPSAAAPGAAGPAEGRLPGTYRLAVDLSGRARQALDATTERTGRSEADTVSRALIVYEWVTELERDRQSLHVRTESGQSYQVEIV
ncbi:hypothetical protein [Actinacidiphila acididurans]|uniref:Ribbon-helix-helix protein CopG domain-containing protein n=1 Tax=Actinacidiphila acididurans TaxID=2784346 RepID=A0ABS2TW30_9ACTN|nr:hypothetical protein [Actinacidiphila acididurans]MBM9506168.1 hypothetical protein [Actinacidiphila acididurans]